MGFNPLSDDAQNKTVMIGFHIVLLLFTIILFSFEIEAYMHSEDHSAKHTNLFIAGAIKTALYVIYIGAALFRHRKFKHIEHDEHPKKR
jgi:uncharacterized membrane protein